MNALVRADIRPGIYEGIPNEAYHDGPGISKSGLWTIHTRTPAHYKFGERVETQAFNFGEACHFAILQPELFTQRVIKGPDDRRGNKWKDAADYAASEGKLLLTSGDYDEVLAIRDLVHADQWINSIITGGKPMVEPSAYWTDPVTGRLCRCRPDLWRDDLGIMLDLKSTVSAHPDAFSRAVVNYGYHAQEAIYTDGWNEALAAAGKGGSVQGFVFLAWEKTQPYAHAVYELPPSIVDEGRAIMRRAIDLYDECVEADRWPGYGDGVQELAFKPWAYTLTERPNALDEEIAA